MTAQDLIDEIERDMHDEDNSNSKGTEPAA
jgi:hypothetical protein